jgi:hypothetical protein
MSTPSDIEPDPIPMTRRILEAARELKAAGLPWTPRVGCFVWDPHEVIESPSPFPMRVYFVLNMQRFINIFGSVTAMQEQLVWLPTWYQARQLCARYDLSVIRTSPRTEDGDATAGEADLIGIYGVIGAHLKSSGVEAPAADEPTPTTDSASWIEAVLQVDLEGVGELPADAMQRIRSSYHSVGEAYLGWLRIKHRQPDGWFPSETALDESVLDALGHFYSDYQKDIRVLKTIRTVLAQLRSIDSATAPDIHQPLIDRLRQPEADVPSAAQIMADLVQTS